MSITSQRIRQRRKQLGYSQDDLSELSGISQKQISRYENDGSDITGANLDALATVLQTSADWLLGRIDTVKHELTQEEVEILQLIRSHPDKRKAIFTIIKQIAEV